MSFFILQIQDSTDSGKNIMKKTILEKIFNASLISKFTAVHGFHFFTKTPAEKIFSIKCIIGPAPPSH